jgi:hypothetical protein
MDQIDTLYDTDDIVELMNIINFCNTLDIFETLLLYISHIINYIKIYRFIIYNILYII